MTVTPSSVPEPSAPYVTGEEVVAHLGGAVPLPVAESCAYAATMAVWQLVNDPGTWDPSGDPVPEGVRRVALHVAAELYKAGSAPGGEYQLDAYTTVPAVITSNVVRKYGAVLAPWARVTGMVG